MIIEESKIRAKQSGNFETKRFKISEEYMNKALWMLINQYRFKVRTPVQEIVSNARDAQRENGNPDTPIKITLPTRDSLVFKVRDYGVGISPQRAEEVLVNLGATTKGNSNDETGGFGIGFKSPLCKVSSFSVATYIDGIYWLYVVAKTANEGLDLKLLDTDTTNEPNGTEVQIPVESNDIHDYIKAACRCTMFWDVQPVFNLEDEKLYRAQDKTVLDSGLELYTNSGLSNLFSSEVVLSVDGIPYEVDYDAFRKVQSLRDVQGMIQGIAVIKLNVGDIDLLQTRESIEDTKKTIAKLSEIGIVHKEAIEKYTKSFITEDLIEKRAKQIYDVSKKFRIKNEYTHGVVTIDNYYNVYLSSKFTATQYSMIGKSDYTISRPRKVEVSNYNGAMLKKDAIKNVFWDDLKDNETETMKRKLLRYHCQENEVDATLLEKGQESNFNYVRTLRRLKANKLSSIVIPVKPKAVRSSTQKAKKDKTKVNMYICYHAFFDKYTYRPDFMNKEFTFDEIKELKVVYKGYSESSEIFTDGNFFASLKSQGYTMAYLAKSELKHVKDLPNFMHIDDFMKTYEPSERELEAYKGELFSTFKLDHNLVKFIVQNEKRIVNKVLTKMARCVTIKESEGDFKLSRTVKTIIAKKLGSNYYDRQAISDRLKDKVYGTLPYFRNMTRAEKLYAINKELR